MKTVALRCVICNREGEGEIELNEKIKVFMTICPICNYFGKEKIKCIGCNEHIISGFGHYH